MSAALGVAQATLWVACVWSATIAALVGLGLLARRPFRAGRLDATGLLLAFWSGYCVVVALLQVWHLALPVSAAAAGGLALLGLAGLALERRELARLLGLALREHRLATGLCLAFVLWLANVATGPCLFGDTGMYHLPMARWAAEHPLVPGLANLHGRFGFNNSSLIYAALFESGPFDGRSHHLVNGPLVAAFVLGVGLSGRAWLRDAGADAAARSGALFGLALAAPATYASLSRHFTSLSTDIPAALLIMVAAWRLCHLLANPREGAPHAERESVARRRHELAVVAALLATAASTKIPALPFAVLGFALVLVLGWRTTAPGRRAGAWVVPLAVVLAVAVPWLARGVVLSGYPVYPLTALPFDVDWRVPLEQAEGEHAWTSASCRRQRYGVPAGPWVGSWMKSRGKGLLAGTPGAIAAVSLVAFVLLGWRGRRERRPTTAWPLLAVTAGAAVVWFFGSPNPRFGFGIMWTLAAAAAALGAQTFPRALRSLAGRALVLLACLATSAYAVAFLMTDEKLDWDQRWLVRGPGADGGLHPYKRVELDDYVTDSGLVLHVPSNSNNTWAEPLPGTPYPARNLALRVADDLASGFRVEGPWQPERWPKHDSEFLATWRAWRAAGEPEPESE